MCGYKKGVDVMNKSHQKGKIAPKDEVIRCRISKELNEAINKYCQENGRTKSDVIIEGVQKVIKRK